MQTPPLQKPKNTEFTALLGKKKNEREKKKLFFMEKSQPIIVDRKIQFRKSSFCTHPCVFR